MKEAKLLAGRTRHRDSRLNAGLSNRLGSSTLPGVLTNVGGSRGRRSQPTRAQDYQYRYKRAGMVDEGAG